MSDPYAAGVQANYDRQTGSQVEQTHYGHGLDQAVTPGRAQDGLSYGGYAGTVSVGPDGKMNVDYSHNGLGDAVNRYQGLGAAAAGRTAYQADYGTANQSAARAQGSRQDEMAAINGLRQSAAGNGPTATTALGRAQADQGMQSALGASASARGGMAAAAAAHAAYGQQAGQGIHGAADLAGMRAGEMGTARGAFGAGATAMRGHDLSSQGMYQRRATTEADAMIQQRQLNQQRQMGMEGLAYGARQAQLAAQQRQDETNAGIYGNSLNIQNQEKNRAMAYLGAGYSTAGAGFAGFSTMGSGQQQSAGGLAPPSGGSYQGAPIQREDPYSQQQQDDGSDPYGGIGR